MPNSSGGGSSCQMAMTAVSDLEKQNDTIAERNHFHEQM